MVSNSDRQGFRGQQVGWRADRSGVVDPGAFNDRGTFSNTWAGNQNHGSSVTGDRINQLGVQPFIFYNLSQGWYVASLPIITADWTVDHNKWTVPIGGGIGRVMPVGDMLINARLDFYYNRLMDPAPGITNVGDWTTKFTLHFVLPTAKAPSLF